MWYTPTRKFDSKKSLKQICIFTYRPKRKGLSSNHHVWAMLVSSVWGCMVWVDDFMLGIVVLIPPVKKDSWNMYMMRVLTHCSCYLSSTIIWCIQCIPFIVLIYIFIYTCNVHPHRIWDQLRIVWSVALSQGYHKSCYKLMNIYKFNLAGLVWADDKVSTGPFATDVFHWKSPQQGLTSDWRRVVARRKFWVCCFLNSSVPTGALNKTHLVVCSILNILEIIYTVQIILPNKATNRFLHPPDPNIPIYQGSQGFQSGSTYVVTLINACFWGGR